MIPGIPDKNRRSKASGFTLPEVIVAVGLVGLVLTVVGSIIVSQLRQNISVESRRRLVEDWGRVAEFIESESFAAERAYAVDNSSITGTLVINRAGGSSNVCNYASSSIVLALVLNDSSTFITYAVTTPTTQEAQIWTGPYVLRRCGPLNTTIGGNGSFTGSNIDSVVVGGLPATNSFVATRGLNALGFLSNSALAARDIVGTLTLANSSITYTGSFGGQARVSPSYNLLNDEATTGSSCNLATSNTALLCGSGTLEFTDSNCPPYTGTAISRSSITDAQFNCALSRVRQYRPSGTATINGSVRSGFEDTIYFSSSGASYVISGTGGLQCNRNYCKVVGTGTSVEIYNGDVIVFQDREIRF
jgi:prepilin-type N-terminal cleavage/methylation domain-containing protein